MIDLQNKGPHDRVLELGGGDHPHPQSDVRVDIRQGPHTDFTADFCKPLPIKDGEFTVVLAHFVLEHLPFTKVPDFLKEVYRVTRPGGAAVFAVPNTLAQLEWTRSHQEGWDGKRLFEAASEKLFGSQNMPDNEGVDHNTHRCYFDANVVVLLFREAGFSDITVSPYGERRTDLAVIAKKSKDVLTRAVDPDPHPLAGGLKHVGALGGNANFIQALAHLEKDWLREPPREDPKPSIVLDDSEAALEPQKPSDGGDWGRLLSQARPLSTNPPFNQPPTSPAKPMMQVPGPTPAPTPLEPAPAPLNAKPTPPPRDPLKPFSGKGAEEVYNRHYFDGARGGWGGYGLGGYRDFPVYEVIAQKILERKPESVLELGCSRGYILKRLQDTDIRAVGLEVSRHCLLTAVCNEIVQLDLIDQVWNIDTHPIDPSYDLCFSVAVLDHLPEEALPDVIRNMRTHCKRGLHGIDLAPFSDGDKTRLTVKPLDWWKALFATHAPNWPVEILDKEELCKGPFPEAVVKGDGKLKINVGSFITMFHHGWTNVDVPDLAQYAQSQNYKYVRHDCRGGLPFNTGAVDLIFAHHFLEHLSYEDGKRFLSDCRRVLKSNGAIRLVVPNADLLCKAYCDPETLFDFDEMNDGCAEATTAAGKLWALLMGDEHKALYDADTLIKMLEEAGFDAWLGKFREPSIIGNDHPSNPGFGQILRETTEMDYGGSSLFVDAIPKTA